MEKTNPSDLPQVVIEYIDSVVKAMKYRKNVRADVREELIGHFTDTLADSETDEEKQDMVEELITEFGDVKLLGVLLRRAKKRCRPLWQQAAFFMLKIASILFLLLLVRVGYMATARPTISVDYSQWMTDQVRGGRDESLNAWSDYQQAIELTPIELPEEMERIDKYPGFKQRTEDDWKIIESYLKIQAEAIKAFRAGADKPYYWNHYKSSTTPDKSKKSQEVPGAELVENLMPQLSGYKKIAYRFAYFQILSDVHNGNIHQATEDTIRLYRFGQHLSSCGVAIEQLVGIAIESIAMFVAEQLLHKVELPAEDLYRLQQIVEIDYDPYIAQMDWNLEKAFWYDLIQRTFTDDGNGGGRPMLRGTILAASDVKDFAKGILAGFPDRKEVTRQVDLWFEQFDDYRTNTPLMIHRNETNDHDQQKFLLIGKTLFGQVTAPGVKKSIEISWRRRTGQGGLLATLAILRYRKEQGQYPESLDELVQNNYLKFIPPDPYSGKPLMYRKTEAGFFLYSVGPNFTDEGGEPGTDQNGKPKQWGGQGDVILWPVEEI